MTACARRIFAERLPSIAVARARESSRRCEIIGQVGYALGGLPGARLLRQLGMASSADTVLRRVKARARNRTRSRVRVLGVDDWAWRKQQRYGTLLMDLEQVWGSRDQERRPTRHHDVRQDVEGLVVTRA